MYSGERPHAHDNNSILHYKVKYIHYHQIFTTIRKCKAKYNWFTILAR